ncbi:MAG: MFS transporter [Armatimonadetes bacterium]|nr:MFS transporter [Armatimonadota bacterium]
MLYYHRNLYVIVVAVFLAATSWNQVVPFLPLFLKDLGVERNLLQWVGLVFAAQSAASMLAQPIWGKIGDNYGRKPMMIRAGLALTAIYFGMSFCSAPWQLAILRFLNGALTGFIPGSFALIATNTPEEYAPRSVATAQTASAAGMIVGPAIGGLLAGLWGYRGSMRVSGTAALISTLMVWWLVHEPNKARPEKTSLLQDLMLSVRSPVQVSMMWAVLLSWSFAAAINPYLTLHLRRLSSGAPDWLIGLVFPLPAAAFVLFAHRWTRFGERQGYERGILIGLIGAAVFVASLATAHTLWLFALLYFLAGIWLSALAPSVSGVTCTKIEETFRGRAYGMQQSAGTLGALVAPLAAAYIGAVWGTRSIFLLVGLCFILGSLIFTRLTRKADKKQNRGK